MCTVMLIAETSAGMVGSNVGLPPHLRSADGSGISLDHRIFLVTRGAFNTRINANGEEEEYLQRPLFRRKGSNLSF